MGNEENRSIKVYFDMDACPKNREGRYMIEDILYDLCIKDADFAEALVGASSKFTEHIEQKVMPFALNKSKGSC